MSRNVRLVAALLAACCLCWAGVAAERAQPPEGKAFAATLSADPPAAYTALPRFGSIEWTVKKLPWVGEGPAAGVSGMGMVALGDCLYVCGGFIPGGDGTGDATSRRTSRWMWRYNPAAPAWERLANAPFRREYVRSIAAPDGVYFLGGGCQYKGQDPPYRVHGDCARLDISQQPPVWRGHGSLNVPRTHMAVGCAGGFLIAAGGNEYDFSEKGYSNKTIRDTCEVYDLGKPEKGWQVRASIPGRKRGWSASVAARECLFLFGGLTWTESNEVKGLREALRYDPKADAWKALAPPPLAMSAWEGALYKDRYVLLVGGVERKSEGIVWSDLVWAYDIEQDRWLRVDGVLPPGGVFNDPGVAILDGTIYVAGAEGPFGTHYNYFLAGTIQKD